MWWTLTGNFGNFLPIDWSKTYARELYNKALHLKQVLVGINYFSILKYICIAECVVVIFV